METYLAVLFLHLFAAILLGGYGLYWTIMALALRRRVGATEGDRLLGVVHRCRWPHMGLPPVLRLPLPWVGLAMIGFLLLGGVILTHLKEPPSGPLWLAKMLLLAAVIAVQVVLTRRPRPAWIHANLALILAIVVISGLLVR
jgi:hypothetical protein